MAKYRAEAVDELWWAQLAAHSRCGELLVVSVGLLRGLTSSSIHAKRVGEAWARKALIERGRVFLWMRMAG